MFVENKFYVGLRDINSLKELKNTSLLSYLEDVACMHSEIAGYGVTNMDKVKRSWIVLSWKIKILKRPMFNDYINVQTWSRCINKFYAFRDFKVYNDKQEILALATSKWVFINTENGKLVKIEDSVGNKYESEPVTVFEDENLPKLNEPADSINSINYKITKNMIDVNNHLNNIYYMDIVKEVLPEKVSELNEFEIMYKKEVKLGETVKAIYAQEAGYHYVIIKNEMENLTHAVIKLK